MGFIAKRGTRSKPRYYAQFKDLDGVYKMRALKGARSQEDAAKALAKIEVRIAEGKPAFDERVAPIVLGSLIERWRDGLANRNARDDRSRIDRYILPNRRIPRHERYPCSGCGRSDRIASTSTRVPGAHLVR